MIRRPHNVVLLVCACLALGIPAVGAAAEPAAELAGDRQRALDMLDESERLYQQGDFQQAAALLHRAYLLHPEPLLLYHLARAREAKGDLRDAIDSYRAYLHQRPDAPDRTTLEERIRRLEALDAKQRASNRRPKHRADEAGDHQSSADPNEPEDDPSDEGGSALTGALPWVLVGVGVAGLGVGAALGAVALDQHQAADEAPNQAEAYDTQENAELLATGATAALIAGGSLAAIGTALGIAGLVSDSSSLDQSADEVGWQLTVGPGAMQLRGRF